MDLSKYSSLTKVCRITAYVRRFIQNCRSSKTKVQEIKEAMLMWIRCAQREVFGSEISSIDVGKPVGTKSRFKTLTPFLESSHIPRVGGRIGGAKVPFDVKHPVIIPQDHQLSRLVILDYHKKHNHEGTVNVRNELSKMYWIPHPLSEDYSTIAHFARGEESSYSLLWWPASQKIVYKKTPPFSNVSVDYFGPIMVKHSRKQEKRYGCLFTRLVTRAVHLEGARSLETDSFINPLRRFVSIRGPPSDILEQRY